MIWLDSVLVPNALPGKQIVQGSVDPSDPVGRRTYIPVARGAFVELVELGFRAPSSPGLFGNKDELLTEWRMRLDGRSAQVAAQRPDE